MKGSWDGVVKQSDKAVIMKLASKLCIKSIIIESAGFSPTPLPRKNKCYFIVEVSAEPYVHVE